MSSLIPTNLNQANELADLSGIYDWDLTDAAYQNPNGNITFFTIMNVASVLPGLAGSTQIPAEQYIAGIVSTYNLINGADAFTNLGLFNTTLATTSIQERIVRKAAIYREPYSNKDTLADLGVGTQRIEFKVMIVGTQYLKAYASIVQNLFDNSVKGLGTLFHPIYGEIENVLPLEIETIAQYSRLNCMMCNIVFHTSDISYLNPVNLTASTLANISKYYIGTVNAISTLQSTLNYVNAQRNKLI